MKIGIVPNSEDFSHPADRRRYVHYFSKLGISYEKAEFEKDYDYLYVSISGNLAKWAKYKNRYKKTKIKPKIIFDLSDDLLSERGLKDFLRAVLYFFRGKNPNFLVSYKEVIKDMISASDQLICGSEEQKNHLLSYHNNIVVMRESVSQEIFFKKNTYKLIRDNQVHIFWEGLSHGNVKCFEILKEILNYSLGLKIHLHIVTDSKYCKISSKFDCTSTYKLLSDIFKGTEIDFHLYDWNEATFSAICASCDIALIPIPNDPVMLAKPENKLLLMWEIGIPVITTATKSYCRVMKAANLDFTGNDIKELRMKILSLLSSEAMRVQYMDNASRYLQDNCSEYYVQNLWNEIFAKGNV
jgi:hypothetical protein